jgi:hypothetical protein
MVMLVSSFFFIFLLPFVFITFTTKLFFIDDRVRAICLAMGMIPVLWTSTNDGGKFDTNGLLFSFSLHTHYDDNDGLFCFVWSDWMVAGGSITGNQSVMAFEQILTNATSLDTG